MPTAADTSIKMSPVLCFLVMVSSLVVSWFLILRVSLTPCMGAINTAHRTRW